MGCPLFMLDADAANAVFLEYIEDLQVRAAWIAEQYLNTFQCEALGENLRPAQGMRAVFSINLGKWGAEDGRDVLIGDMVHAVGDSLLSHVRVDCGYV